MKGLKLGRKLLTLVFLSLLSSCVVVPPDVPTTISISASKTTLNRGETASLYSAVAPSSVEDEVIFKVISGTDVATIVGDKLTAITSGQASVQASVGSVNSNILRFTVSPSVIDPPEPSGLTITASKINLDVEESVSLSSHITPLGAVGNPTYKIVSGAFNSTLTDNILTGVNAGQTSVNATLGNLTSNTIIFTISDKGSVDPYENIDRDDFYQNYTVASSASDAKLRSFYHLMSGTIDSQDQEPVVSLHQPTSGGKLVRNTSSYYSDGGETYTIVDSLGNPVKKVYKGGAYIALDEVAAHVFAFGTTPANHVDQKVSGRFTSNWGEFLRGNNSYFSGNVIQYPYEPILPDIRGAGGVLYYYEMDIGTNGTDCDPAYSAVLYNDGTRITRGAARIVYTRYDENENTIIDINDKYLFYTYNHYNDFQEYLNYFGGWGEIFGNITGGGVISSTVYYNPTSYPSTARSAFN